MANWKMGCMGLWVAGMTLDVQAGTTTARLQGEFLSAAEAPSRELAVFTLQGSPPGQKKIIEWLGRQGQRLVTAQRTFIWDDVGAYDVCADSLRKGRDAVILVRPSGLYAFGNPEPFIRQMNIFAHPHPSQIPQQTLCFDLYGDGRLAFVVPDLGGFTVWRAGEDGRYQQVFRGWTRATTRFFNTVRRDMSPPASQRVYLALDFPRVSGVDVNGDQRTDVCVAGEDRVVCYLQGKDQSFSAQRQVAQTFMLRTAAEASNLSIRVRHKVVDINGDKRADVLSMKTNWGLSDMMGELRIYLQQAGGRWASRPAWTHRRSGFFDFHQVYDLNGDGKMEIVSAAADVGITDLAQILISRSLTVDLVAFRNQSGLPGNSGDDLISITYPVSFKNFRGIAGGLPRWDVRLKALRSGQQLLIPEDGEAFKLHVAQRGALRSDPVAVYRTPLGKYAQLVDLDGNGLQEIVVGYPGDESRQSQVAYIVP